MQPGQAFSTGCKTVFALFSSKAAEAKAAQKRMLFIAQAFGTTPSKK